MVNPHGLGSLSKFNEECFKDISTAQRTHYLEEKDKRKRKIKGKI